MSGVATAIGGAAVVGAIASDRASDKAADASASASRAASAETRRAADEARGDINRIFPSAQRTGQEGFQSALDVFGQSLPAQTDAFTQGNVGAQQAILSGLPQIQNALLGGNVDFSQLQPFESQSPDLGFFQQTLPQLRPRRLFENKLDAQGIGGGTRQYLLDQFDQSFDTPQSPAFQQQLPEVNFNQTLPSIATVPAPVAAPVQPSPSESSRNLALAKSYYNDFFKNR